MNQAYRLGRPLAAVVAVAVVAGAAAMWFQPGIAQDLRVKESAPADLSHAKELSKAFRQAAKDVIPSVVTIQIRPSAKPEKVEGRVRPRRIPDEFRGTPFERFFNDDDFGGLFDLPLEPREESGLGTGVIIDPSGIILTNNHVVRTRGRVIVRLSDGQEFEATDIKTDPRTDLAVIRIKGASGLKAARLGDSDSLEIGDWVLAIGAPFGLNETVTAGIISAKGRGLGIAQREDFLQTDAAINPGNSGGPLINLDGQVVGINTAISSRTGGYQGVGFAIPINLVRWVSQQLIAHGTVKRAYLGARIQQITPELAKQFGLNGKNGREGVLIADVVPNSPASEAGLKRGDVVLQLGTRKVATPGELVAAVEQTPIGDKAVLKIVRDGKPLDVAVTVKEQPKDYGLVRTPTGEPSDEESTSIDELGIEVGPLTEALAEKLGVKDAKGVAITGVERGSLAAQSGLAAGQIITEVNRTPIASVEEFREALKKRSLKDGVLLLVTTSQGSRFVVLKSS